MDQAVILSGMGLYSGFGLGELSRTRENTGERDGKRKGSGEEREEGTRKWSSNILDCPSSNTKTGEATRTRNVLCAVIQVPIPLFLGNEVTLAGICPQKHNSKEGFWLHSKTVVAE